MKSSSIANSTRIALRNLALAVPLGAAVFLGLAPSAHAVPPVTNGLVVWLSADSINPADTNQVRIVGADTFVKQWNDGSGNGHHAINATAAEQPKYITSGLNGKPVLRFTEASPSKMFLGDLSGAFPTAASFFAVSTINADGRYNLFDNCNSDSRWVANTWTESKPGVFRNGRAESGFAYADWPQSGSHVFAMESSSSIYRFVKDGGQIGTATANYYNGSGKNWTIGCRPDGDQTLNGDIPELILYNRVLTTTEANLVGAYLTAKYGLTNSYPPLPLLVNITSPFSGQGYLSASSITATAEVPTGSGTPPYHVSFYADTAGGGLVKVGSTQNGSGPSFSQTLGVPADGTYHVYASVTDSAGTPATVTSATNTFNVAPPTSTATTLATAGTTAYGQTATFTATVAPVPTGGTVQFYDNAVALGAPATVNTSTGLATYSTSALGAGSHPITAVYSGYGIYLTSTSGSTNQVVNKAVLNVTADNKVRSPGTSNPALTYQISGYQLGQTLATSGVSGTPTLACAALSSDPVGNYPITVDTSPMSAANYSFTGVAGNLKVVVGAPPTVANANMACWYDAGLGVTTSGSNVTTWNDQSGNGHHATPGGGTPTLVASDTQISKPSVHIRGTGTFLNCAGTFFTREQYLVVRSPNVTWNGPGCFLGRNSTREASYNFASGTTGFWQDQFPTNVSKNGFLSAPYPSVVNSNTNKDKDNIFSNGCGFAIDSITNYMILRVKVGGSNTIAAYTDSYWIGKNNNLGSCDMDIAEIIGYDSALSAADEAKVGRYLAGKYAIAAPNYSFNDITSFTFPGYGAAVISGSNISMTVPYGTNLTTLAPTYTVSPLATGTPASGTSRNFTTPQTYTITAQDSSTQVYTVTVTAAASSAKDILTFGPGATITGTNIAWTVPYGTDLTNLAPAYTVSPLATGSPASGTSRNFTTPQTYTITAQDNSTQVYTVTVTATPASTAKTMLTFGPGATITGTNIAWTVPYGTDLTNLTPTYTVSPLATASPASGTSRNFTTPQTYTVTAQDNSTQVYTVTVTATPASTAKTMLTFGPGATITGTNIVWTVPFGTDLTSLAPTYTVSPLATASPVSGTSRNFTTPQTYTVTAQNGSTQTYTTSVTVLPDNPTTINVNYSGATYASLNGYYYNDLSASGSATQVAPAAYSGNYWNDFGGGGNNSSNLKDSHGLSTGIGLTSTMQAGPWADWNSLGNSRMLISGLIATYPNYVATIALTGLNPTHTYSLYIASLHSNGTQTSTFQVGAVEKAMTYSSVTNWTEGKTHVAFTGLTPTAGGTLTVNSKSTGELVLNGLQILDTTPQNDILSFTFPTYGNATIAGTNISITVPYGTNVSAFSPTYTLSYGATCVPASGSTQNFTNPVHYVVTATDSSTKDYTVTVNVRTIADPQFILTAPSNWDGRQTITVQATVTNAALLASTGGTNLNYKWSVDGVAATQTSSAGTMTLTYAQGNGPMTLTLLMDNGGWPTSHTATINVQQPASEAWVQRTPDANEKPVDGQFFARDDSGYGKIYYLGTQSGTPDTVYLKVYRTDTGSDVQYGTTLRQALVSGAYNFSAPILGGLYKYKVIYGTTTGGIDSPLATVSNLICGDAYILEGQSNTVAETPNNGTPPEADYYTSDWIRSYGNLNTGTSDGGWGVAVRTRTWGTAGYGRYQVGCWGLNMARTLLEQHNMPICLVNGAVGGTRIDQHLRNEANPEDQGTIYGRLLTRLKAAKLTHGIRAVLWHQGEQDQGREGPYAGDFDYKWYHQNFANVSGAWKQNYPNIKNYYIFQIWPAACGDTSANDMLRETQRTLPYLYSNMRIMSTLGIVPGSGCHYTIPGYEFMANLITPLVEQDHYGRSASEVLTAPDLKKAYFTSAAHTEIALEFGQNMAWNTGEPGLIYLDGVAGKVASGSATGTVVKLQLTAPSTASTITYLVGSNSWTQGNLLYGSNGIAALTFAQVPLTTSTTVPYTSWITGKGLSGANAASDADPDHDGIQNALEYVLGGEPNPANAGSNSSALLPTSSSSNGNLIFTFKRKDASEGAVTLSFQWSTDLTFTSLNTVSVGAVSSTVNGIVTNVVEDSPDSVTDSIVITVPAAKAAGGKLFGRLNATAP